MCRCSKNDGPRAGKAGGSSRYTNGMLTAIAVGLGVLAMKETTGLPPSAEASGQRTARSAASSVAPSAEQSSGFPNAAEQRLRMIAQLQTIEGRLRSIEARLSTPLEVRVIEMPAVAAEPRADAVEPE